jgi:hypothetical protein
LDEYQNILPKSINIHRVSDFEIKPILDSIDRSILSISHVRVSLKSKNDFEQLLMVSNLAKSIDLHMIDKMDVWEIK